jgi:cytoskeletal protein RodZ
LYQSWVPGPFSENRVQRHENIMTKDLDSGGSGNAPFACGHENSPGNHYCDACGAARDRRKCPACNSPNREEAKFCGACGAPLQDEGAARETIVAAAARSYPRHAAALPTRPTTGPPAGDSGAIDVSDLFGLKNLEEAPSRSGRGRWRRDDLFHSSVEEDTPEDDMFVEDNPPPEHRHKRLFLLTGAAVIVALAAVAIGLAVGQFGATRHGGTPARPVSGPPAAPGSQRAIGQRSPDSTSTRPSAPSTEPPSAPPDEATMNPSIPKTARTPASAGAAQPLAPSPPRPARTPTEQPAQARNEAPSGPTPPAAASGSEASEERMADFLVEQLGPVQAVEKALSNAAWYDVSQSEHSYWQGVAETIRRRPER